MTAGDKALCRVLTRALLAGVGLYLLGAALLVSLALAEQPCAWAVVTVASQHFGEKPGKAYNEQNWGLGGENCLGRLGGVEIRGVAGFYRNSNRVDSFYFGGSGTFFELGAARLGLAAVLVSGYEVDPIKAVFPVLAIEGKKVGLNLSYFPSTKSNVAAAGLQVKWRWR